MTRNPFGCHRAQMHAYNDPWWSFTEPENGHFRVHKKKIAEELLRRLVNYRFCPALDIRNVLQNVADLPNRIDPREEKWKVETNAFGQRTLKRARPVLRQEVQVSLSVNEEGVADSVGVDASTDEEETAGCLGCGCLTITTSIFLVLTVFLLMLLS